MIKVLSAFVTALVAMAVFAADAPYQDIKGDTMRVYGVRGAYETPEGSIRVVLGAACTGAMGDARCWRIVSDDDPAYAYSLFVAPKAARSVESVDEFPFPAGFKAPSGAGVPLRRSVVDLVPPTPLKPGCEYAVLGQGHGDSVVTLAVPATTFVCGKSSSSLPVDALAAQISGLRRLSSVGDGKILAEFGQGFNTDAGNVLANYRVTVNGKETPVVAFGRRTRTDAYQPAGWPFHVLRQHDIFLDIGRVLQKGDKVALTVAENVTCGAREASFTFDTATSYTRSIQVNQNGYLPDFPKIAYLGCWFGSFPDPKAVGNAAAKKAAIVSAADFFGTGHDERLDEKAEAPQPAASSLAPYALAFAEPPAFQVVDARSGAVAWRGKAKFIHNGLEKDGRSNNSASNVYELDFTGFRNPGRYYIAIDGVGRSFSFDIGPDVYRNAFRVASLGVFAQRCGIAFDRKTGDLDWNRIACHTNGIQVTDIPRHTVGGGGHKAKFRDHIVRVPAKAGADNGLRALLDDPSLIAYFPLDGDERNRVPGSAIALSRVGGGGTFVDDGGATGKAGCKSYQSTATDENGFTGKLAGYDPAKGLTASFWLRRNDAIGGGNEWGGAAIRFGDVLQLRANWGLYHFQNSKSSWRRIGDNEWHHVAIVAAPRKAENGPVEWTMYADGERIGTQTSAVPGDTFLFGGATGKAAAGTSFDELRIYARAFSADEAKRLGTRVSDTVPLTLQTSGGHHDAGDYNPRSHIDVARSLLSAYELAPKAFTDGQLLVTPAERRNGIPDIVDEALWAVKLWVGLQDPEDGGVYNGTESQGDPSIYHTVELDRCGDFCFAKDSKASFEAAAIFAQTSRILAAFPGQGKRAADLLARARRAYAWGVAHKPEGLQDAAKYGEYTISTRAYAAAELFHTTWEESFHEDFKANCPWIKNPKAEIAVWTKYDMKSAAYSYTRIPREKADPALWDTVLAAIRATADMYIRGSGKMAYKFLRDPWAPISWGTGAYENYALPVAHIWRITGETKYRDWLVRTCDNTLGANPLNISWIMGFGTQTIRMPLHNSRFRPAGFAVAGQQAQGPNQRADGYHVKDMLYPAHRDDFASLHCFVDGIFAIGMDEGTVNNQANTMAVFGLLCAEP